MTRLLDTLIVCAFACALLRCTPRQRAAVADVVGELAAEVCVEGDTVAICLRKCEAEAERRR